MNPDQVAENKGQKSETLKTGKQYRPSKSWFCEKINKVDKSLVRMTERKDGREITRIKNGTETPLPALQMLNDQGCCGWFKDTGSPGDLAP